MLVGHGHLLGCGRENHFPSRDLERSYLRYLHVSVRFQFRGDLAYPFFDFRPGFFFAQILLEREKVQESLVGRHRFLEQDLVLAVLFTDIENTQAGHGGFLQGLFVQKSPQIFNNIHFIVVLRRLFFYFPKSKKSVHLRVHPVNDRTQVFGLVPEVQFVHVHHQQLSLLVVLDP